MSAVPSFQKAGPRRRIVMKDFRREYSNMRRARAALYMVGAVVAFIGMGLSIVASGHRLDSYDLGRMDWQFGFLAIVMGCQGGFYLISAILTPLPCKSGQAPWYRTTILDLTVAAALIVPFVFGLVVTTMWAQYYTPGYSRHGYWEVYGFAAVVVGYVAFTIAIALLIFMSVSVAQVPAEEDVKWKRRFGDWFDLVQPWQIDSRRLAPPDGVEPWLELAPTQQPTPSHAPSRINTNDTVVGHPSLDKKFAV